VVDSRGKVRDEDFLELSYTVAVEEWKRRTTLGKALYPWWFLTRAMLWAVALLVLHLAHLINGTYSESEGRDWSSMIYKEGRK